MNTNRNQINRIKEQYPEGTRILLESMEDMQAVPPGTRGVVEYVDDIGTIHMEWDNGSSLGLVVGKDKFSVVTVEPQITVLVCEQKKALYTLVIENDLESMQKLVDGNIECVQMTETIELVCKEEGKLNDLEANRRINNDIIAGTFFIVAVDICDVEFMSLTKDEIDIYSEMFAEIENIPQEEVKLGIDIGFIGW